MTQLCYMLVAVRTCLTEQMLQWWVAYGRRTWAQGSASASPRGRSYHASGPLYGRYLRAATDPKKTGEAWWRHAGAGLAMVPRQHEGTERTEEMCAISHELVQAWLKTSAVVLVLIRGNGYAGKLSWYTIATAANGTSRPGTCRIGAIVQSMRAITSDVGTISSRATHFAFVAQEIKCKVARKRNPFL